MVMRHLLDLADGAPAQWAPVAAAERHAALDVLRGIALLLIFLVNMEYFVRPLQAHGLGLQPGLGGLDHTIAWGTYTFVEGKAWCLFALLFGMGFAVMHERSRLAPRGFAAAYVRRALALLVIGAAHVALLWAGDVLHVYAIAALALLALLLGRPWWLLVPVPLFALALSTLGGRGYLGGVIGSVLFFLAAAWIRRGGPDRLWKTGIMLYLSPPFVITLMTLPAIFSAPSPERMAARAQRMADMQATVVHAAEVNSFGSYLDNLVLRIADVGGNLPEETRLIVAAVGLFLIGTWFVRAGIVRDLSGHRRLLARNALVGVPLGAALAVASSLIATGPDPSHAVAWTLAAQVMALAGLFTSVGVASGVMWLCSRGAGLRMFAPVGRMALTNYLLQSLVCTLIFYGYGLGLAGEVDRTAQLVMVVLIFACQMSFSTLWLQRFNFGPMEWLWRSVTYLALPAMSRKAAPGVLVPQRSRGHGWH
jgi:uncharacterized protein